MSEFTENSVLARSAHDYGGDLIEDRSQAMSEEEMSEASSRTRHGRGGEAKGDRNGHCDRQLVGRFGTGTVVCS